MSKCAYCLLEYNSDTYMLGFRAACVSSFSCSCVCLKGHLEAAQPLPDGWIVCADSTTDGTLVLAKLSVNVQVLTADATLLLRVDEELRWSVSCHGILVEVGQSRVLTSIPPQLNSM